MFDKALEDIEGVLASTAFLTENIEVYPEDYFGDIKNETEFCRVLLLPTNSYNIAHGAHKVLDGILKIRIFVKSGLGQKRHMEIADILDKYFENKTLTNNTKLETSYLNVVGLDTDNPALSSAIYSIPFKSYGE